MKIVITGTSDSGKTALTHILKCQFAKQVALVPDVLNFCRDLPEVKTIAAKKSLGRLYYHVQKELENLVFENSPQRLIICDRGSLDHLMHFESLADIFTDINSNLEKELSGYEAVIQINSNPKSLWNHHQRLFIISNYSDFENCAAQVICIVNNLLRNKST